MLVRVALSAIQKEYCRDFSFSFTFLPRFFFFSWTFFFLLYFFIVFCIWIMLFFCYTQSPCHCSVNICFSIKKLVACKGEESKSWMEEKCSYKLPVTLKKSRMICLSELRLSLHPLHSSQMNLWVISHAYFLVLSPPPPPLLQPVPQSHAILSQSRVTFRRKTTLNNSQNYIQG